jgi:glycolate oxidase iron-sulfur subunit
MQTHFAPARLADPEIAEANDILRTCVHCGFCLATCPTYLILGNEMDSPRGRIYLAKEMLEADAPASAQVVKHLDRCLTCLSCMTTCPSGVHYGHLVDKARVHIENTYTRPWHQRALRRMLATVVPNPALFRMSLAMGSLARPLQRLMPGKLKGMLTMAPRRMPPKSDVDRPQVFAPLGPRRKRVALFNGCAQQVLKPEINEATVRVLSRHGCEVYVPEGQGCCGAIVHHMGRDADSKAAARANLAAWRRLEERGPLDAVVFNASGCGVSLKDYGHLLREEPDLAEDALRLSAKCRDVSEILVELGLNEPVAETRGRAVTYHMACSMQHGLGLRTQSKALLTAAGFTVREPAEAHICCGSAGTYSILEPDLAGQLRGRKVANLEATAPEIIAAGNIGCITHIAQGTEVPVVHTVELLDWATGGPKPAILS